jgi:hypothetical protein
MAEYLGDFAIGDSVFCDFNTRDFTSHAPATLSGTPSVVIYNAASFTPITLGIFLSVNINGVVGLNHVDVVATAANGYIPGNTFYFVIAAGTVGGVSMVGEIIASFSIANRSNIRNFPGGTRTLMVDAFGVANANVINVAGTPQTAGDIIARLPAALVLGKMDSNVSGIAAGIIGSTAFSTDAINANALAADAVAEIQNGLAKTSDIADLPTNAELAEALDAIATATEVADAILRRNVAGGSDGVRTVSEALYALRNKTEIIGGFLKVYQTDDATVAWQGAVTTAPGDPLTSIDPA